MVLGLYRQDSGAGAASLPGAGEPSFLACGGVNGASDSSRDASNNAVVRYIMSNDSTSTDEGALADSDTGSDGDASRDPAASLYPDGLRFVASLEGLVVRIEEMCVRCHGALGSDGDLIVDLDVSVNV